MYMDSGLQDSKRFYYCSPFVPAEWIAAHGFIPHFLRPSGTEGAGPVENNAGVCAYMRAFVNEAVHDPRADGILLTTACDQMRRAFDVLVDRCEKPVFLMHVPATWQSAGAHRYYRDEIVRLGEFLARCGAIAPSQRRLVSTMEWFEQGRRALLSCPSVLAGPGFTAALNAFFEDQRLPEPAPEARTGVPVAVVGGPLSRIDCEIFDIIADFGGIPVLDGTENGERMLPGLFDRRRLLEEPLSVLCDAYFGTIADISRRPNTAFFSWLKREIENRDARGVILTRYIWCDCWHAEVSRISEWLQVPCVDLDLTGQDGRARNRTRIGALIEALL